MSGNYVCNVTQLAALCRGSFLVIYGVDHIAIDGKEVRTGSRIYYCQPEVASDYIVMRQSIQVHQRLSVVHCALVRSTSHHR